MTSTLNPGQNLQDPEQGSTSQGTLKRTASVAGTRHGFTAAAAAHSHGVRAAHTLRGGWSRLHSRGWKGLAFGDQPRWVRPSAAGLLVATAFLYLWNLAASGYANSFYAAAIQAGTKDWTALLFGSLDAGNAITVDKPPAALWIPALAGRVFGFSATSMLVPEALMGVAAVGVLYLTVKRVSGPAAGLLAGGALALTPVAALMFRFNNPDAMLTLCLVLAAYLTTRAIEKAGWKWLAAAGVVVGLAFLSKMLQGFLIVPGLALAYLWAAPTTLGKRFVHLLGAAAGILVVAGSYIALFQLTPASARPYMAGSEGNSFLELTFGYNGLGRITGSGEGGAGGGMPGGGAGGGIAGGNAGFGGQAGIGRLFGTSFGSEVSWLLPASLLLLAAGLWFTRREVRSSARRAAFILWGGWLLVTAAIFSFMGGIVHPYYTVALAPSIAAIVGIGGAELWRRRSHWPARIVLAAAVLGTGLWSAVLLGRDASWLPWIRIAVVVLSVLATTAVLLRADRLRLGAGRLRRTAAAAVVVVSLLAGGLGAAAWTLATAATAHSGSIPTSGPSGSAMGGFGGVGAGNPAARGGRTADGARSGGTPGATGPGARTDASRGTADGSAAPQASGGMAGPGGMGGESANNSELNALLTSSGTKWSAIVSGATQAANLELATGTSVIALGGWNGGDPYPTLAQFEEMVANGQIGYFIAGGSMGGGDMGGGRGSNSEVAAWVAANFTAQTVGNTTVYKLSH
ncbi:4-amino-4-deoxy-L-arabinose transferase-like glycosyltransferase [Arthrobacter pascens]|uniref:glycosyltransferase family 39 protein n=1 Tax=Arthrobacter pascens TaxID=1677 RepID=UPI002794F2D1|nr:glycosyltransferase family 39 protein [Arthrobacter pascens]MDQ0680764.1 4-amino-4-deoxy-L-arabinose transferase-like glycosyltransferase [Arthrobacter pascens]